MKYTVIINGRTYNTNNRDTVMCLLADNPTAEVIVNKKKKRVDKPE